MYQILVFVQTISQISGRTNCSIDNFNKLNNEQNRKMSEVLTSAVGLYIMLFYLFINNMFVGFVDQILPFFFGSFLIAMTIHNEITLLGGTMCANILYLLLRMSELKKKGLSNILCSLNFSLNFDIHI